MNKRTWIIILNALIVVCEAAALIMSRTMGWGIFWFYTHLSNLLLAIGALLMCVFMITKKELKDVPAYALMTKFAGTVAGCLTFLVVIFLLIPQSMMTGGVPWYAFYMGSQFILHLSNPLLGAVSFLFFENDRRFNKKKTIWIPVLLTLLYGIVMIIMNYLKVVVGPYFFLMVYAQPWYMTVLWVVLIIGFVYLLARFLLVQNQKQLHRQRKKMRKTGK